MTTLLQRAVAEVEKLPAEDQDAIAVRLLAEVEDERHGPPASPRRPTTSGIARRGGAPGRRDRRHAAARRGLPA